MSDIFISYKREEQPQAKALAGALERQGWSVWWDPNLRAGEHFDDVIEKALHETKCVIVLWSRRSVESRYVRDEATYALNRGKLVPVAIEDVSPPFRFEGIQTVQLSGWDGSDTFPGFQKLVQDLISALGAPPPPPAEQRRGLKDRTRRQRLQEPTQSGKEDRQRTDIQRTSITSEQVEPTPEGLPPQTSSSGNAAVAQHYAQILRRRQIRAMVGAAIGLIALGLLLMFRNRSQSGGWGDFSQWQNYEATSFCAFISFFASPVIALLLKPNQSGPRGAFFGATLGVLYWVLRALLAWPTASYIDAGEGIMVMLVLAVIGGIIGWLTSKRWAHT